MNRPDRRQRARCGRPLLHSGTLVDPYRTVSWDSTGVGPVGAWSDTLRPAVDLALDTRLPVTLLWSPDFSMIYNEAFVPLIGHKHPAALGAPAREVFPEI